MDPLSLASSYIAVVQHGSQISERLKIYSLKEYGRLKHNPGPNDVGKLQLQYHVRRFQSSIVLLQHLQELVSDVLDDGISSILVNNLSGINEDIDRIGDQIGELASFPLDLNSYQFQQLSILIDTLVHDVGLMRDLCYGTTLHRLTIKHKAIKRSQIEQAQNGAGRDRESLNEAEDALQRTGDTLRATLMPQQPRPSASHEMSFPFNILSKPPDKSAMTVARVQLDTGCKENWISAELVERAQLQAEVEDIVEPATYVGFTGNQMSPTGRILITWFSENESLTRVTWFLIHTSVPFDAVLRRESIIGDGGIAFSSPLLALKHLDLDDQERRIMETNAREKGASNKQIADIRKASDAARRQEARRLKAASVASTPGRGQVPYPGCPTPSNISPRSSFLRDLDPAPMPTSQGEGSSRQQSGNSSLHQSQTVASSSSSATN